MLSEEVRNQPGTIWNDSAKDERAKRGEPKSLDLGLLTRDSGVSHPIKKQKRFLYESCTLFFTTTKIGLFPL